MSGSGSSIGTRNIITKDHPITIPRDQTAVMGAACAVVPGLVMISQSDLHTGSGVFKMGAIGRRAFAVL